jgi:AcrR family transcriptional regulator
VEQQFEHIIEQVSQLYQQYGIKSVTMDDVARELGMSKKTLYNYVANKDDLVGHYVEHLTNQRKCNVESIKDQGLNAIEEFFSVNEHVIELLKHYNPSTDYDLRKYYPHHFQKLREFRRTNMYHAVRENMLKGKQEGLYRQDLDDDIIARVHVSRIENSFANEMFEISELTSRHFVREMMIYHMRGICNDKGIEFFNRKLKEFEENPDTH